MPRPSRPAGHRGRPCPCRSSQDRRLDQHAIVAELGGEGPGQRVEGRLGDVVGRQSCTHRGEGSALTGHVERTRPCGLRRVAGRAVPASRAKRRTGSFPSPQQDAVEVGADRSGVGVVVGCRVVHQGVASAVALSDPSSRSVDAVAVGDIQLPCCHGVRGSAAAGTPARRCGRQARHRTRAPRAGRTLRARCHGSRRSPPPPAGSSWSAGPIRPTVRRRTRDPR